MAVCDVSGRRVILSFNFSCNFFQSIVLLYNHRKDVWYFHQKKLQKEQNDVVESPKVKSFSFR